LLAQLKHAAGSWTAAVFHRAAADLQPDAWGLLDSAMTPVESAPTCRSLPLETPVEACADITRARLAATRDWLSSADPDHYSVQLLQAEAEANAPLDRFLSTAEARKRLDHIYIYRSDVRGNPMLSVLYGSYANYAAASEAVRDVESMLPGYQPYVRTVRRVMVEAGTPSH